MLEIEERRVGLAADELEGAEEDTNSNTDAIGEKEALAEVTNGVGDAGLLAGVVARRVVLGAAGGGSALAALQLLDGLPESVLGLAEGALGVGAVG